MHPLNERQSSMPSDLSDRIDPRLGLAANLHKLHQKREVGLLPD